VKVVKRFVHLKPDVATVEAVDAAFNKMHAQYEGWSNPFCAYRASESGVLIEWHFHQMPGDKQKH